MQKMTQTVFVLAATIAAATPATAITLVPPPPPIKVWVSNTGADSASCGSTLAPCRTFHGALAVVANGGEIGVLTPGDYGEAAIETSINITDDGSGEAGILVAPDLVGVSVGAGVGDVISLRGLVIDGKGFGGIGINIAGASAVHVQNCVIRNLESAVPGNAIGILFSNGTRAGPTFNSQLFVSDTIIFNNGSGAASGGIFVNAATAGSINAVLDRVHLENNVVGLSVDGSATTGNGAHVILRDSVVSGNAGNGIQAVTAAGKAPAFIVVERTSSVNNAGAGILANGPGATMLLNDNTIARNSVGLSAANSGQLISYGNNRINNNIGPDGTPTSFLALN